MSSMLNVKTKDYNNSIGLRRRQQKNRYVIGRRVAVRDRCGTLRHEFCVLQIYFKKLIYF